ncbi:MAG: polymer-forming cytoskeletal protein [Deltaproteobacteria bacterium]|jgi:cytoskeletal protein CcmA (bactofilin family)|nr:polymer-forming cytoskeletal protein [Deltaproteobacteria bacterium]
MANKKKEEDVKAFLGKGAEFTGKLIFNGTVRIDGKFSGEIYGGGTLVVGEGASLEADINVDVIVISGDVHGQIDVKERIEIHPPGRLEGNVRAPIFVIKEGGIFEGISRMDDGKSERE